MQFLPDMTLFQLVIIVALAAFLAIAGGVAGYGTGALMPLILVPMVGAAPVVPIIAISAMFSNTARVTAFRRSIDRRRVGIALAVALPACALGAWLYTLLTGRGAAIVIGIGGAAEIAYGHFTTGGIEDRIDSTLPPVRRPKIVPRS